MSTWARMKVMMMSTPAQWSRLSRVLDRLRSGTERRGNGSLTVSQRSRSAVCSASAVRVGRLPRLVGTKFDPAVWWKVLLG
jgi:hypothetical protein